MPFGSGGQFYRMSVVAMTSALGLGMPRHTALGEDRATSSPAVSGSTRAARFIADCIAGSDCIDIAVIGDSNTGSAIAGLWGYHNGLSEALLKTGAPPYATPVYPTMLRGTMASTGGWRSWAYLPGQGGSMLRDGSTFPDLTVWSAWNCGSRLMRYGPTDPPSIDGWAYVPSGSYRETYNAVYLAPDHPMAVDGEPLVFRVRYGAFAGSGGRFTPAIFDESGEITRSRTCKTGAAAPAMATSELDFRATGREVRAAWSGAGSVGPVAIQWQSIYRRRAGWSVTSHAYMSGATPVEIADAVVGAGSAYLEGLLREHRERQSAAGGTGRLLLWIHGGINGATTPEEWSHSTIRIVETYRTAWRRLGYPADDLAAVAFVGVGANPLDLSNGGSPLEPVRRLARSLGYTVEGLAVTHMPRIVSYSELVGPPSLFQGYPTNTVHLSGGPGTPSDGYALVSGRVIDRLLRHADCPADLDADGQVGGSDLGILIGHWGDAGVDAQSDLTGDGLVDGADLGLLIGGWGACNSPPTGQ